MKKILKSLVLLTIIFSTNAYAQEIKPYVGVGMGGFTMDFGLESKTSFGGYAQFGLDYGDYLGAELRLGTTTDAKTNAILPVTGLVRYKFGVDYFVSYLGKVRLPISEGLELYAVLGGTSMKTRFTANTTKSTSSKTGFSYGGGINYNVGEKLSLGVEWVRYASDADITASTFSGLNVSGFAGNLKYSF